MYDAVATRLRAAGCVFAEDEARILLEASDGDPARLESLLGRRVGGEPLEQVVGWAELGGRRIRLTTGVFVPRQRSLLLVELAASAARDGGLVVDLCCGSGGLGAVLAERRPDLALHAADLDPAAVACARLNLPPDRVHEGDLFEALPVELRGRVDVLLVNAPYVPTDAIADLPREARDHEHRLALDGGRDGLDVHRRVLADVVAWLAPRGLVLMETSSAQAPTHAALATAAGLTVEIVEDDERGATVVVAVNGPAPLLIERRV